MNAIELMEILGNLNCRFYEIQLEQTISYFQKMIDDERVILISKDKVPYAVMTFSITNDPDKFLKKGVWDYLPHDPKGTIFYAEKLMAKGWDKELRINFESLILALYPQIEYGIWHRYGKTGDRQVTTKRRLHNVRD